MDQVLDRCLFFDYNDISDQGQYGTENRPLSQCPSAENRPLSQCEFINGQHLYIVSFWNSSGPVLPLFSGYHTVAISYDGTNYIAYNYDLDLNDTTPSKGGIDYYLNGKGGYYFGFFIPNS